MTPGGLEVLRFWRVSDSRGLSVRVGEPVAGRLVALQLGDSLRPHWLPPGEPIQLWLEQKAGTHQGSGDVLAHFEGPDGPQPAIVAVETGVVFLFDPDQAIEAVQNERYLEPRRPLHSRLPLPYQVVPGTLRLRLFRLMLRLRRSGGGPAFPASPQEPALEALRWAVLAAWRRVSGQALEPTLWPNARRYALALSHDVDTARGLARIPEIAALEEAHGFRSCWFVVGNQYPIDEGLLEDLRERGHEVALHGDRHDNRLPYLPSQQIERRLERCSSFQARFGVTGFRSPSLLETKTLRERLRSRFRYTSDVPDSEIDSLVAPRRGCATCFPFLKQRLLEVPITLPVDDKLLLAGAGPEGLLDAWRRKLAWIGTAGGLAQLLLHAEPHLWQRTRVAYARLLVELADDATAWRANPGEIARWWLERRVHG